MNAWIKRGLQTALLTGGFVAVGAGIASADENDVTVDVAGLTATVPVSDGTVLGTPVETGNGEQLTVTGGDSDSAGGLSLPVDTNDDANTSVDLGEARPIGDSVGGISVPVTVTEADGSQPDPQDGLTVTVPTNTSDGNEDAGTTVIVPVVTGNLGDVLDQDPTTGNDVDVNLEDLVVVSDPADGTGRDVQADLADLVTIGGSGGATSPRTLLSVPVSADGEADTTVSLPVRTGDDTDGLPAGLDLLEGAALSGNDVDVNLGSLVTDGSDSSGDGTTVTSDPILSVPVDSGNLGGGDVGSENTIDVNLARLLALGGVTGPAGTGSVITVPVNDGAEGTAGNNLITVTLPVDLTDGTGTDGDTGNGTDGSADRSTPAGATTSPAMVRGGADASSRLTGDAGAASTSDADTLAYTGADPLLPALVGLLAIIAGLLLLHVARRRRSALQ